MLVIISAARAALLRHPWPGNVRELLNEMRRLTAFLEPDTEVAPEQLSRTIRVFCRFGPSHGS